MAIHLNRLGYQLETPCENCSCRLEHIELGDVGASGPRWEGVEGAPPAFRIIHCPLHAAAPKLLDALIYYRDEAISSYPAEFVCLERAEKFAEVAEAAIKATGRPDAAS